MTIILHVGAGKCGSSSLQAHLSGQPLFSADDGSAHYEYVCITRDGNLLRRDGIQRHARMTAYDAQVSAGAEWPWATDRTALETLSSQCQKVLAEGRTPVASQESWLGQAKIFEANEILPRLGIRAKVVIFVRPQVPWLNSAWWQWGAWSQLKFRDWIEGTKRSIRWTQPIGAWRSVPGVDSVEIHLGAVDVVSTFFRSIGIAAQSAPRRNSSLDENLLRYLQGRLDLRSVHASLVDFVLERRLAAGRKGTPWVLEQDQISELIEYYRADNKDLSSLVSGEAKQAMERDPMWWDRAAYAGREAVSADAIEPSIEALQDASGRAIDAVMHLDRRVRALEAAQRDLTLALDAQRALTLASDASNREMILAKESARRAFAALEAEKRNAIGYRLRKAISINGIRRLAGV